MPEVECGTLFCKTKTGKLVRGASACGTSYSVNVPVKCPTGSKPYAFNHNHPGGSGPSYRDLQTSAEKNIVVCVTARGKVKCYRGRRS